MIKKSVFEDELISGMQTELTKQASAKVPELTKAADCLHAALEIFEAQGLTERADQVLKVLQKLAQGHKSKPVVEIPTVQKLMEAGLTQRDMHEFTKGNPVAKAKLNLVLRQLGMSDHQIAKFLGPKNVMSEKDAREVADPNRSFGKMWDWMKDPTAATNPDDPQPGETVNIKSIAQQKFKTPSAEHLNDKHTHGLTPEKMVENLKHHGTEFNMVDDNLLDVEVEDSLEVSDNEAISDFEDERD